MTSEAGDAPARLPDSIAVPRRCLARPAYDKPQGSAAEHTPLRRDSAGAAVVLAALESIRFRTLRLSEVGNRVTWPLGRPPAALAPVLLALRRAFGTGRCMWP